MPTTPNKLTMREVYDQKKLKEKYRTICQMIFAGGRSDKEIGKIVGLKARSIHNIRYTPLVQEKLAYLEAMADESTIAVHKEMIGLGTKAVGVMSEILSTPVDKDINPASVRANTATTTLKYLDMDLSARRNRNGGEEVAKGTSNLAAMLKKRVKEIEGEGLMEIDEAEFEEIEVETVEEESQ